VSAVRQAPSRKAREVAHPQLSRAMLKDKPALYFAVKVAHPATLPHRALALPVTRCTIPLSALEGVRGAGNRTAGAVFLH
jgi:hypothetical protein